MLRIVKRIESRKAKNAEHGNVQQFLERLLVDVAAANYRYFLSDYVNKSRLDPEDPHKSCHSPLLENEKQLSGLFASSLASFCPVFRPEFPLSGHVDFMATYGQRDIALENKRVTIESIGNRKEAQKVSKKWLEVVNQSKRRLELMAGPGGRFHHPASIGLLVVRMSQKVRVKRNVDAHVQATEAIEAAVSDMKVGAAQLGKSVGKVDSRSQAHFVATYEFPREMQLMKGWKTEKLATEERVFPGVVFLAHVGALSTGRRGL